MKNLEIFRLLIPLLAILFGIVVKNSNKQQFNSVKKYWLYFVIGGTIMFFLRLINYFND